MFICRLDPKTSYNLEMRIIGTNTRSCWYSCSMIVDSGTTNFKDLVAEIVDKYPCGYGEVVKLFYYCAHTKSNIQVNSNQDLVDMFAKHVNSKTCSVSIAYHLPTSKVPNIPLWDAKCGESVEKKKGGQKKKVAKKKKNVGTPHNLGAPAMNTRSKVLASSSGSAMGTRSKRKLNVF